MLNVLSRDFSALRCLRQSCGQLPRLLDQSCPLGGALSQTSTRCTSPPPTTAVTPAAVAVVATHTIFAATPTVAVSAVATVAASLFPPVLFCQLFLRGSAKDRAGVLVVGHQQGLGEGKGRGGSRLSSIGRTIQRVQAASTERTSACRDAGLSDERRAQAVSTTAVANAEEKSTLDADAMHTTMPLKKASFPGRGRWGATPCGRGEGKGAAVAPAAADATDWARACCTLFAIRDASRAAVFACSISSPNPRRRAIVWLASSSAR